LKRFLQKKFLAAGVLAIAGIAAFAGTCTFQHIALTTIGSNDVFAGELHNDSGANILQHNLLVAFVDSSNTLLDTQTVTPCLRTLPSGGVNYFSAKSSYSAAQTTAGLARVKFDSTFKVGTAATGAGSITGLTVGRGTTTLTVAGTFKNTDSTTLTAPNACAVVYNSSGNVVVVGLDETMSDLAHNVSDTFSISLTVPDDEATVDHVDVYVDGLQDGVPILPIKDTGNTVNLTPTATATASGTPGAATKLVFQTTLGTATHGSSFGSVKVAIEDANGVVVTSATSSVTLSIASGTGSSGAALTCTTSTLTIAAVSGVATFTPCKIDLGGVGYQLKAASGSLSAAYSNAFNVTPGAVAAVVFTTDPGDGTVSAAWSQQPVVELQDADGARVWNDNSSSVALTITGTPSGVTLACTTSNSRVVSGGVATFAGCNINRVNTGYQLHAVKSALTADSGTFDIVPKMVFTQQPSTTATSGSDFAQQPKVSLEDGDNSVMTGDTTTQITLTSSGGTFVCTNATVTVSAGVATFAGCNITGTGTRHLIADDDTSPAANSVSSNNIVVS
jgi:hypothetical protein